MQIQIIDTEKNKTSQQKKIMKTTAAILLIILSSCGVMPQLFQSVEDVENNDAIGITVSKDAVRKDSNVNLNIDITKNNPQAK